MGESKLKCSNMVQLLLYSQVGVGGNFYLVKLNEGSIRGGIPDVDVNVLI